MSMWISIAQARAKCASRSWDRSSSSTSSSSTSASSSLLLLLLFLLLLLNIHIIIFLIIIITIIITIIINITIPINIVININIIINIIIHYPFTPPTLFGVSCRDNWDNVFFFGGGRAVVIQPLKNFEVHFNFEFRLFITFLSNIYFKFQSVYIYISSTWSFLVEITLKGQPEWNLVFVCCKLTS